MAKRRRPTPGLREHLQSLYQASELTLEQIAEEANWSVRAVQLAIQEGIASRVMAKSIERVLKRQEEGFRSADDIRTLGLFSHVFADHPKSLTWVSPQVPYDAEPQWRPAVPVSAVSYRELTALWMNPAQYRIYDARQVRYLQQGGKLRRTFLVGGETDQHSVQMVAAVIQRHLILGLPTKLFPRVRWGEIADSLGVNCHMFIVLGDSRAIFLQYIQGDVPVIVQTAHSRVVHDANAAYDTLWNDGEDPKAWLKSLKLPARVTKLAHAEAREIEKLSQA